MKLKLRFLPVYPLVAWMLLVAHSTERQLRVGVGLALLGLLIRFWSNGYVGHAKVNWTQKWRGDAKIGRLVTAGPYAFVRHPLYLGSLLIGAGVCVIAGNIWVSLAAMIFVAVAYRRKMVQEEALLLDELGAVYQRYYAVVPRWFPNGRRYAIRNGEWRWQGIRASKEWKTIIWVVVLLIAFYFREELLQERDWRPAAHGWHYAVLIGFGGVLIAIDLAVECLKRFPRAGGRNAARRGRSGPLAT